MITDTNNLTETALDWAVAKAVGKQVTTTRFFASKKDETQASGFRVWDESVKCPFRPSINWNQGGSFIETYNMELDNISSPGDPENWTAYAWKDSGKHACAFGPTPLIAICRAVVWVEIGSCVDLPAELSQ